MLGGKKFARVQTIQISIVLYTNEQFINTCKKLFIKFHCHASLISMNDFHKLFFNWQIEFKNGLFFFGFSTPAKLLCQKQNKEIVKYFYSTSLNESKQSFIFIYSLIVHLRSGSSSKNGHGRRTCQFEMENFLARFGQTFFGSLEAK